MKPFPYFQQRGFTLEQIQAARIESAKVERGLLAAIESGKLQCNGPDRYAAVTRETIARIESGEADHSFTIWQRINYCLTGDCPALLP